MKPVVVTKEFAGSRDRNVLMDRRLWFGLWLLQSVVGVLIV